MYSITYQSTIPPGALEYLSKDFKESYYTVVMVLKYYYLLVTVNMKIRMSSTKELLISFELVVLSVFTHKFKSFIMCPKIRVEGISLLGKI